MPSHAIKPADITQKYRSRHQSESMSRGVATVSHSLSSPHGTRWCDALPPRIVTCWLTCDQFCSSRWCRDTLAPNRIVMRRRDFLQGAGLAITASFAAGCAARRTTAADRPLARVSPSRQPLNLTVPRISWERVIRTTVGLRPHRDSGFVLKVEKFDEKTVIHDYGFGGAGMSLAWGCGAIAAGMALEHNERKAAATPRLRGDRLYDDRTSRYHL